MYCPFFLTLVTSLLAVISQVEAQPLRHSVTHHSHEHYDQIHHHGHGAKSFTVEDVTQEVLKSALELDLKT